MKGENVSDWLFVKRCTLRAIDTVFHTGKSGETYNIGGFNEWRNIEYRSVLLCQKMDQNWVRAAGTSEKLITYVTDRAGHDHRYAIDATQNFERIGIGNQVFQFEEGIELTHLIGTWKQKIGWIMSPLLRMQEYLFRIIRKTLQAFKVRNH